MVDLLFVIELFSLSLAVETFWAKICQSCRFRRRWVIFGEYLTGNGHRPPTTVGVRKLEWLPFRVVSECPQSII